ncbi:MAG TPA: diguanylate cyclase [Gemmatimonadaceae bacterium]|nr:diguanylate cyclase [Gemmatimonadaceae bacterium]
MTSAPRVVIADDDDRKAGVLTWVLRERGYDVTAVASSDGVLSALRARPVDLLVLDAGTAADAEEVLKRVRADERGRDLPIIVTEVTRDDAPRVLRGGANDWLPKPLQVRDLLGRMDAQLRSRAELRRLRESLLKKEEDLQRALDDIAATRQLVEILNEVTADLTAAEIYRILARRVARALDLRHCSVVLAAPGESTGTVVAAFDDPSITDLQVQIDRYPELAAALRSGRPVLVADVLQDPMFADVRELWKREGRTAPVRSVLAIPFSLDRRRSGIFFLRTERGERVLTGEDGEFTEVVIRAAVAAIRRAQALESTRADNRRLEELATTDALTRLLNRRALLERLSVEVDRARRFHQQLSMLMLDIDHFKSINDRHGHLVGDDVLRQMGTLLSGAVRTIDVIARYGGEEFVLVLPETSTEGAAVFGERLRERVEHHAFELGDGRIFHLTCSVGVATFPSPRVSSTEDLFARADEALYRAKSGGRNQVCT